MPKNTPTELHLRQKLPIQPQRGATETQIMKGLLDHGRGRNLALLVVMGTLSMGATNCRFFGNYQESAAPTDPYSGYYEMSPQTASLWVVHSNRGTLSVDVSPQQIPDDGVTLTFSPLVAFLVEDLNQGVGRIISMADTSFYQYFRWTPSTGELSVSGPTSATNAWDLSACSYRTWYTLSGKLNPGSFASTTGTSRHLSGRISLTVEATTQYSGECADFLDTLQACYSDLTRCGPPSTSSEELKRRQAQATGLYGSFIKAGVISSTDIARSTALSYRMEYR